MVTLSVLGSVFQDLRSAVTMDPGLQLLRMRRIAVDLTTFLVERNAGEGEM